MPTLNYQINVHPKKTYLITAFENLFFHTPEYKCLASDRLNLEVYSYSIDYFLGKTPSLFTLYDYSSDATLALKVIFEWIGIERKL